MKIFIIIIAVTIFLLAFPIQAQEISKLYLPDEPGPYQIGHFKVSFFDPQYGRYKATIRYPALRDGWFAPKDISGAPYPGIIVANGFAGSEWNIKWIPKHLSSHGYITICSTPPNKFLGNTTQWACGFFGGIEKLKYQNDLWFSPIFDILDMETFGAIGLSMGGAGCIEATGAFNSEIDAAVSLAPASSDSSQSAAQNITVPIQLQVGNNDGMVPPARVLPYYTDLISNSTVKEYLSITGGNHIGFIDEYVARLAEWLGIDSPRGIEFKEQRRVSSKYFTAWFQYYLKGLNEYYTYIFGDEAQNDLNEGILSDLRYNLN
jgi:dienelactone hydrolase